MHKLTSFYTDSLELISQSELNSGLNKTRSSLILATALLLLHSPVFRGRHRRGPQASDLAILPVHS